jgi:hypothetical protein
MTRKRSSRRPTTGPRAGRRPPQYVMIAFDNCTELHRWDDLDPRGSMISTFMAPPWVRTDLMNSREAEEAMPLDQFHHGDHSGFRDRCR